MKKSKGLRIGIVASRFNQGITKKLLDGATRTLKKCAIEEGDIKIDWVPGAFEIPLALQRLARTEKYHALIALGAVVRGETPHFDFVASEAARGVMQVSLHEGIPVAFGVLTTNNMTEALDRAGGRHASPRFLRIRGRGSSVSATNARPVTVS